MPLLSKFEMASHHRETYCVHRKQGLLCDESTHLCVLFMCRICNLAEGSLTTECPGEKVDQQKENQILSGEIDYHHGKWVTRNWQ